MVRKPTSIDPRLASLLDERDHLRIQISLLDDAMDPDPGTLLALRQKLVSLERQILQHWGDQ